ncbi:MULTISPECIES: hypothetical protein [Fischerella]|uniref:Uncharacterized protein n=1 Tax=Fischerella muscicola CCMEE 5323 TaxID=2019572 RepID=A0A2N6K8X8_FISMU|nr:MULTISPECIES: hypothetical protein [Fischerella]MBD2435094.1 hypothetical protein [Fischerella sp. FACHB-380]PLZ94259.1 hypothetical protein CEN44_01185 [Fischerella muscicola CCMEE 5323]
MIGNSDRILVNYLLSQGIYLKPDTSPHFENIQITEIIPALVELAWQVGNVQASEELTAQCNLNNA